MGRKPRIEELSDGDVTLRVRVPRAVWQLCLAFGKQYDIEPRTALDMMLRTIGGVLGERRRASEVIALLGPGMWMEPFRAATSANHGVLASGVQIDLDVLHTNPKLKSGFVGVYASGTGFRAVGKDATTGRPRHLGTYHTAEEAAWARYQYYKQCDMPYGYWEDAIVSMREREPGLSEIGAVQALIQLNEDVREHHKNSLPGLPERLRKAIGDRGWAQSEVAAQAAYTGDDPGLTLAELRKRNDELDEEKRRASREHHEEAERLARQREADEIPVCDITGLLATDCVYCTNDACSRHGDDDCDCDLQARHERPASATATT